MREEIIKRAHEFGHFGIKKTMEKLLQEFSMENMQSQVEKVISACVPCILGARKEGKKEGFLRPIPKADVPMHTWHLDHIGPLPDTNKDYRYLLVVVDGFTRYTWFFATKTKNSEKIIRNFKILQQHYGNPHRVIVDRGGAFASAVFKNLCKAHNIELHAVTTGVPRGNGQVERVHSVLIGIFTKITVDEPNTWYKHLTRVQHAINGTYHRSIAVSPYELLFGIKLKTSQDLAISELLEKARQEDFLQSRAQFRNVAVKQIHKVQQENRNSFEAHRKSARRYRLGDIVAIKRTQFGSGLKFALKYFGPYQVVKIKDGDRYEVEKLGDGEGYEERILLQI
ncbi:hypothetical protein TKK_0016101 [Trichogramma kaykai]|uniref:RNA-directed DNA polymerase n=1 Tax=Trichogramma kaykai TaxID=54128 RepID=A0ABD2W931_9HYME